MTYLSVNFSLWSFKEFYTIQNLIYCHQRNFNIFQKVAKTTKKRDVIGEWATKKDRERDKPFKNIRKQKHTKKHILSHLPFKFVFLFCFLHSLKVFCLYRSKSFFSMNEQRWEVKSLFLGPILSTWECSAFVHNLKLSFFLANIYAQACTQLFFRDNLEWNWPLGAHCLAKKMLKTINAEDCMEKIIIKLAAQKLIVKCCWSWCL